MLLPVKWLKDYVKIDKDVRVIADKITATGSHVESIDSPGEGLKNIVVGVIQKIEKHPNADKLVICQVDVGKEVIQIVTGAPNVFEGAHVPTALIGAVLADDFKIKKSKFRGEDSFGMFCSYQELGFNVSVIPREFRDGVLILENSTKAGEDVLPIIGLHDDIVELEITPNRPDCLSVLGIARETAATFGVPLNSLDINLKEEGEDIHQSVNGIEVQTKQCMRYYSRLLENVKIGPSPQWLQNRLMASGIRPINNIVDLTNYVMLEVGQPLHAFDLDMLYDKRIIVRQGKENEVMTTLDGVERKLRSSDIVIADGKESIGIAGVMGGMDSEVTENTTKVLLEGANFNRESIRNTSKEFVLRTEASSRFEKGLSPVTAKLAVDRVCQLVEEIGIGKVAKGFIDVYPDKQEELEVSVRPKKVNDLLGTNMSVEDMVTYLNRLEIQSVGTEDKILSKIPSFRTDLYIEEDLVEEIGRLYGFENIVPQPLRGTLTRGNKPDYRILEKRMKQYFMGLGYDEFMTYSFISPKSYDKLNLPVDSPLRDSVMVINPLGEEYSVMRRTLLTNMLEMLSKNANRKRKQAYGYEFGNTFTKSDVEGDLPKEKMNLAIGFYGEKDFYFLKQTIEIGLKSIGLYPLTFERERELPYFHPGRGAKVFYQDYYLGSFGEIHPEVLKNYGLKERVYAGELDFELITKLDKEEKKYKPLPKFPSTSRDFSFLLPVDVEMGKIKEIVVQEGKELLEDFHVFDIYQGKGIEEGKKSVAFTISYRGKDHTLTDEEVNPSMERIVKEIEKKLQGVLRS
ncbi:MAG: phenylalanine--tRNA ligase subunit beta [Tissierellia bacterium]|nr:phenylalanine--tRNA ligase subunit beta [Tissierellia bacterium]